MAKNQQNWITQPLDSEATKNSQPTKLFIPWATSIPGADPEQPSINPETRREQYNIENRTPTYDRGANSDVPESTKIGWYNTVAWSIPKSYYPQQQTTTEDYLWAIKKLPGFSYYTNDFDNQLKEVEKSLREQGIDTTKDIYGQYMTEAAQQMATINMQLGQLKAQESQVTNTQATNAKLVYTLAKEVWSGLAQGQSISQIAQNLWQEERVIQKIANNQTEELVQLNADYEEEQLRSYLRNREDLDIDIARNIAQYNNIQKNLDYQFDSAMETLRRNEFDAKRAAKETSGIYGMTGTEYTLNRIQKQYDQQMWDIKNTYNYQSASAQMAINNALEDYSNNLKRRAEDYAQARKGIQGYALQTIMNIENNIGLSADQMAQALTTAYKNVTAAQSNAMSTYLEALDNWNTILASQIANAYGLWDLTTTKFTDSMLNRGNFKTVWESTNSIGNILASNDGIRIGTYTNPKNWYTYNVYATREDGLNAAKQLLHGKRYRWKTMKEIAQTWTWNSNPTTAWAVMQEEGLNLSDVLTEENIDKLLIAMWRREGTLQKWQTLDDWLAWWQDLSSYKPQSSIWGVSTEAWDYFSWDTGLYEQYLAWKNISSIMAAVKKNSDYGATETERVTNFTRAAQAYQRVASKESAWNMIKSLSNMAELKNSWDNLSDAQKKEIWTIGLSEWWQNYLIWRSNLLWWWKIASVYTKYATVSAQWFIDTLVDSKKEWAAYWQLSDKEWDSLRSAWSSLSLKNPNEFGEKLDDMINNIVANLRELWYTDEEIAKAMWTTNLNPQQTSTTFNTTGRYGSGQTIWAIPWQ